MIPGMKGFSLFLPMKPTVADLPFNRLLELETVLSGDAFPRLPAGEKYHNHLGTVHAGALLSVADATISMLLPAAQNFAFPFPASVSINGTNRKMMVPPLPP